ncbi:MAG: FKBP-type peptidyl-prolyl cis-trans isomerase [Bacteroidales bacterium]
MKYSLQPLQRAYLILLAASGFFLLTGCPDNTEEEMRSQEQRFFELYVAANYPDVEPQPNGIYFLEHEEGSGSFPDSDDWLKINHVTYVIPQEEIVESYIRNVAVDNGFYDEGVLYGPYKMQNGTKTEGLTEGLMMMREGSQATMFFTSELGYGGGGSGSGRIQAYQSLKYEVELLEVIKDIETYEQNRLEAYVDTIPGADTIQDPTTDFVIYYVIDEPGEGDPIEDQTRVEFSYTGYLIDGRVVGETDEEDPELITIGDREAIMGWELGIPRFLEGARGRLIIPYQLAFGDQGGYDPNGKSIPPYENVIYDIEILDTNPPADAGPDPEE